METYNCSDLVDGCVCINVKIKDAQENQNYKKVYEFIQKQNNENSLSFIHFMHNIVMFFTKTDVSKCIDYANDLHNKLNNMGITATIGVSEKNSEFNGIPTAYGQANKAIGVSVLLGRNKVVTFSEYQEIMKKNSSKKEIDWDEFSDAIINCRREEVLKYVSDYTEIIKAEKIPDEEYLKLMAMTIILRASSTLNKYGTNIYQLASEEEVFQNVREIRTIDDISECVIKYIKQVCDYHEKKRSGKRKNVIKDALDYVNRNLYNPELSLKKVASDLYINDSYLSREFKKTYGVSFIEYISRKRIEASKKLLKETELKVYEVAEKIGFKDSHYFCICFLKSRQDKQ